jgi:hypothetical protein
MDEKKLICILLAIIGLYYGVGYYRIECYSNEQENKKIIAKVGKNSISEIGYVWDKRIINNYWEGKRTIIWWIKIPKTNKLYACSWYEGFSGFIKDDAVILIHYNGTDDNADYTGYVIGMHEKIKGKSAWVNADDVENFQYLIDD